MYVCIKLFIGFDEPYNIIPTDDVYQNYSAPQERLRPYLDDGFEIVGIEPHLFGVYDESERIDNASDITPDAANPDVPLWDLLESDREWPDAYYDTGRVVYMVKELEDVNTFDRYKYKPDDYECILMHEREDWVYEQVYCFRPENDPFAVYESLPFKEFPHWPDTVVEPTPEEKAAEKERIQELHDALRRGEIEPEDIDVVDLLIINGMMHKELDKKVKDMELFKLLMQQYEDGVPL